MNRTPWTIVLGSTGCSNQLHHLRDAIWLLSGFECPI